MCGNFGLILLNAEHRDKVMAILRTMVQVTMMRGAQSGGVATFYPTKTGGLVGVRSRVVNGKRTDLSLLVTSKAKQDARAAKVKYGETFPQLWAGHTRFATTSISSFAGTHPHQWTPPEMHTAYVLKRGPRCTNGLTALRWQKCKRPVAVMLVPQRRPGLF